MSESKERLKMFKVADGFGLGELHSFWYVAKTLERAMKLHKHYHPDSEGTIQELELTGSLSFYEMHEEYPFEWENPDEDEIEDRGLMEVAFADIVEYHEAKGTWGLVCTDYEG